jgi:hypothetical protein
MAPDISGAIKWGDAILALAKSDASDATLLGRPRSKSAMTELLVASRAGGTAQRVAAKAAHPKQPVTASTTIVAGPNLLIVVGRYQIIYRLQKPLDVEVPPRICDLCRLKACKINDRRR